ncbi:hypothetical protein [Ketogulonicigenium vulgare]|uniref:Uncharacterized protein n=1 Tax=Ketogulonicigenium vulgare (strain WSH-001) TaxID=759362 RepID=F9Y961_KETVW|nr:hypothetical protein [Ketogulonicigenium vulgare]ADO43099.1 conserved hypothetical protein [Ketogulonicigenium vulgare Y25]AEM41278.1 hypothetical protein KVU_1439 [Ketogulonicigenium vulgare WSH-001]ALJ81415.1 hypothetical protein KVH_09615 [Ketogulonicigenium vulgare]ANW34139.1 hypothetical protein KvSKV_09565 [Ketogulonicigenium vulgare]AOZ55012.1 hypothetical protein KVC_2005 [Ketogulonicigenium vulgare]
MLKTNFSLSDDLTPLSVSDLPLVVHPGKVHVHWAETAHAKRFDILARVRDRLHVALRCQSCGDVHVSRVSVVMTAQPLCPHCVESRWRQTALTAGLTWRGRDPEHRHYAYYGLPCGHDVRRQVSFVERVASGTVAIRCENCLVHREEAEASRFGWQRIGRDPQGNANYRLYRHGCGHEQRIAVANLRWGQCDCAGCGESWTAKPSYIYLLDIRHPQTKRHYLKLGYSSHPVKRHKHQLGLPKNATVEVLRVVAMPTGHDACAHEKAAHARLSRQHPEALVPNSEYQAFMNVVSEIYRPVSLSILQDTLDRIEVEITDAVRIRNSDTAAAPPQTTSRIHTDARNNPESQSSTALNNRSPARGQPRRRRRPMTDPRDPNPILRRHWGLTR